MDKRPRKKAPASTCIPPDLMTPEEEQKVLREFYRRQSQGVFFETMEELLISEEGFGLTTATNLQRAICRVLQGLPLGELGEDPKVLGALGGVAPPIGKNPPAEVDVLAAIRSGKSLLAALLAIWASQHCNLDLLSAGEIPRYSVLSLELDNAKVVLAHLLGALSKPRLARLRVDRKAATRWKELIEETGADVIGSEFLVHPSGRPVEIRVVAGKRAGGSLVSRWSAGCTLDEAPRMVGASEGVVNYDDARRAVRGRLLPGAQLFSIGSPWQSWGPMYNRFQKHFGNPTEHHVIMKATGPDMNPFWWTPERCAEIRLSDPTIYQTDVLAEFADAEETIYPAATLNACTAKGVTHRPWERGHDYSAAIDPATRGNAWTLVIADRKGRTKRMVFRHQWIGSPLDPLSPKKVMTEVRDVLYSYKLDWAYTDQWAADAIRDIGFDLKADDGRPAPVNLIIEEWNVANKVNAFLSLAAAMANNTVEILDDPVVHKDFKLTKKIPTASGKVSIQFTKTEDGRHCDYAPATARCFFRWLEEEQPIIPAPGEPGYARQWETEQEAREEAEFASNQETKWWEKDPWT